MFLQLLLLLLLWTVLSSENFGFPTPYEFMSGIGPDLKDGRTHGLGFIVCLGGYEDHCSPSFNIFSPRKAQCMHFIH